jgi:murein DD-endopeptidase MepM/ murein hydrolase activator NlpD
MDVITFFQENQRVSRSRFRDGPEVSPVFSLASFRAIPALSSFPVLFVLFAALVLSLTPVLQEKVGLYRLDRLDFPDDAQALSSMRELVTPEPDASLLATANAAELPASIRAISWSTYKVRAGETLGSIAARFGLRNIGSILSANSIANVRRITAGQVLKIPSMDGIMHIVSKGDSLGRISAKYGIPVNAILDANDLSNAILVSGQALFIPGATLASSDLRRALGEFFMYPIQGRLTSVFGYRADPFTGVRTFHTGIDLAAPTGTPIKASLGGKVATTGFSTVYGNYVILSHDDGYQTLYGHMSYIGVTRGQSVSQGTVIGRVGSTGYSTGSHVHLSVYKKGKMIDPLSVLK